MRRRTLKVLAVSYLVKTLLVGIAWVLVPDLPDRALQALRATLAITTP
jgi:hypothetical protein